MKKKEETNQEKTVRIREMSFLGQESNKPKDNQQSDLTPPTQTHNNPQFC